MDVISLEAVGLPEFAHVRNGTLDVNRVRRRIRIGDPMFSGAHRHKSPREMVRSGQSAGASWMSPSPVKICR